MTEKFGWCLGGDTHHADCLCDFQGTNTRKVCGCTNNPDTHGINRRPTTDESPVKQGESGTMRRARKVRQHQAGSDHQPGLAGRG